MATPNIVPRADSEGGLGTASKYWASAYIDTITTTGDITVGGIVNAVNLNLTDSGGGNMIVLDSSSGDGTIRWEDNNTQKWDMGRDNTDQSWCLSNTPGLGSGNVLKFDHSTGNATFAGTINGIPFYSNGASFYTHDVSSTDNNALRNSSYGTNTLSSITTGDDNTAIGNDAGKHINSGKQNTLVGSYAGDALTSGQDNVAIGVLALSAENGHGRNIAIGSLALLAQDAGVDAYNVAIGYAAGTG